MKDMVRGVDLLLGVAVETCAAENETEHLILCWMNLVCKLQLM